jgi:hypothetical protein
MKAVVGQYHYTPRGRNWAVYIWDMVSETGATANKVCEFFTKKEASDYVYEKNGWTKKY